MFNHRRTQRNLALIIVLSAFAMLILGGTTSRARQPDSQSDNSPTPTSRGPTAENPTLTSSTPNYLTLTALPPEMSVATVFPPGLPGAFLGVQVEDSAHGVSIVNVFPGSPAERAGLQSGDILITLDNVEMRVAAEVFAEIASHRPGDSITMTIRRNDQLMDKSAVLDAIPAIIMEPSVNPPTPFRSPFHYFPLMGYAIAVQDNSVRVVQIVPGGPADLSGLHIGDLIVEANGHRLDTSDPKSFEALLNALSAPTAASPAAPIHLVVMRDDHRITIDLALHNNVLGPTPPRPFPPIPPVPPLPNQPPFVKLGVVYDIVTPQLATAQHLNIDYGALVLQVFPNSPAAQAGIKPGDVITAVDGDKVDAKRTLAYRMLPYVPGDTLTLTVVRDSDTLSLSITLASRGTAMITTL